MRSLDILPAVIYNSEVLSLTSASWTRQREYYRQTTYEAACSTVTRPIDLETLTHL